MKRFPLLFIILLTLSFHTSCQFVKEQPKVEGGDTITLQYATNLTLVQHDGWVEANMLNPWDKTKWLHQYALVSNAEEAQVPEGYTIVNVPLRNAAVFTSVNCGLFCELGCGEAIGGVCEPEYINLPYIHQRLQSGDVMDLGSGMQPNIEPLIRLQPDALLPSPFQDNGGYGKMEQLGIPIIECADYMETSALGRAEWIRFYGRLLGKEALADSIFKATEAHYNELKATAQQANTHPTLLVEMPTGAAWYVPGGQSTMGRLYQDAGASYLWADTPESGSMPLGMENIISKGLEADIWIMKYNQASPMTLNQLRSDNANLAQFHAFKTGNVYACNTRTTGFYESTPFHPDRLLSNLIQIFHPELSVYADYSYFCKVDEK